MKFNKKKKEKQYLYSYEEENEKSSRKFDKIIVIIIMVTIILSQANLGIGFEVERFLAQNGLNNPTYVECTVGYLLSNYRDDEETEAKFVGQYVEATGMYNDKGEDYIMLEPYTEDAGFVLTFVWCDFTNANQKKEVKGLKRGDVVIVKGLITDVTPYGYNLDMHDIEIVEQ